MPVIYFDLDIMERSITQNQEEAEKTAKVLKSHQRPEMLFFPGPEHIAMQANNIDLLVVKVDFDNLKGFLHAVSPDRHYFLNSKAALCTSGLPRYVIDTIMDESFTTTIIIGYGFHICIT